MMFFFQSCRPTNKTMSPLVSSYSCREKYQVIFCIDSAVGVFDSLVALKHLRTRTKVDSHFDRYTHRDRRSEMIDLCIIGSLVAGFWCHFKKIRRLNDYYICIEFMNNSRVLMKLRRWNLTKSKNELVTVIIKPFHIEVHKRMSASGVLHSVFNRWSS